MTVVRVGQPEQQQPRRSLLTSRATPGVVLLVLLGVVAFRLWIVETAFVEGLSMANSLMPGDGVLVLKSIGLERFDVVVLSDPQSGETVIKRIVGLPGETVSMVPAIVRIRGREVPTGSQLYINGEPYDEPYATSSLPTVVPPMRVPEGSYYMLGDNRDESIDSRAYGPVSGKLIVGVGVAIVYPLNRIRAIPRSAGPARPTTASPPS